MTFRDGTLVDWHPFEADAFAAANDRNKPLLLCLTAPWCGPCREMDEAVYSDPKIAANLSESFLPVRVDVDRNPRVRERYNMGGFPSTVFCTPDGEVLSGATYLGRDGLRQVLDSVRRSWDAKGASAGTVPRTLSSGDLPAGDVDAGIEAHMVEQIAAAFDEEFGGWGTDAKFPLPRAIEFAAKRDRDRATRTLEAVRTHLFDTYDGGFYRFAETRRWGEPHREKLTDENAGLLRAFATGYLYTGDDSYRKTAERTIEYLTTALWVDTADGGAFAGSQATGEYYLLGPADREDADPPSVDTTIFADRNGLTAEALLRFAAVTDDERAFRYAERTLDYVLDRLTTDGAVTHFFDPEEGTVGGESGLLSDQTRVLSGLCAAAEVLGPETYLAAAEAVADHTIESLQAADGSFRDGPATGPGLLDRPLYPLEANAELANALLDLWALTGESRYRTVAGEALSAFAGAADRMGVEVAGYATACARYHYDPLIVRTPPAGTDLHRAALRIADHEKVVVPEQRDDAVVVRGGTETTPAETPEALIERASEGTVDEK
ncbi:MAG: DUF255 domain-containing protein [Natronomonas sp.]